MPEDLNRYFILFYSVQFLMTSWKPWNPWTHRNKLAVPRILVVAFLFLVLTGSESAYAQQGYTPDSLFIVLFSDGDALIEYDVKVADPLADQVPVKLFGNTIGDLIVTDFEDKFVISKTGASPNELMLTPAGATDIRISYSTPDLVGKSGREWTFAIDSPVSFSLKMPADSKPLQWGENVPTITQIGSQTLLTFRAGNATVTYIIGFLGTEEAADIAITFATTSINLTRRDNPSIILTKAQELLASAIGAYNAGQFVDAESLATQASGLVEATVEDFGAATAARDEARTRIAQAEAENRDTAGANALFEQSDQQFEDGDYSSAADSAEDAVRAIGEARQNVWPYGIGAAVAGAIAGAFYVIKKRQSPRQQATYANPDIAPRDSSEPVHWPVSAPPVPGKPDIPAAELVPRPTGVPESQVDKTLLAGIVHRIIEEKPHLRQEDRDVLVFLAQSEGAAFESEVRTRFQLPKTTVWRLVKRLEREELVEIRKAGGQNLIKLRFEGRQP